jgi:hypothetical protein
LRRADVALQAIRSLWMYLFQREGKFDKGPRDDASKTELVVGMSIRVNIQTFMYDEKKSGGNVFPADTYCIPAHSLVEIMVVPNAVSADKPGLSPFGLFCAFCTHVSVQAGA